MRLIIFDIDGTIVDSINADDTCFIQTFEDLYQIDLSRADWSDFKNVTDTGLTMEIFEIWLRRKPNEEEIAMVKSYFKKLLYGHIDQFAEIEGALAFIEMMADHPEYEIGFATGGWRETAEMKCQAIGLNLNEYIFKSSDDHYQRETIIERAIKEALEKHDVRKFESITYFGDGLWDLKTTQALGIGFIGVDTRQSGKLANAGAEQIVRNFTDHEWLLNAINKMRR